MEFVNKEIVYNGHFKIVKYQHLTEPGGKIIQQECFERGNAVAAVVYDSLKKKFIFTKQFRIGALASLVEIVAGTMDVENESPQAAMKRELMEELGYDVIEEDLVPISSVFVSPGGTSEKVHLFFCTVSHKTGDGGGVEDENIDAVELTYEEVSTWVSSGKCDDAKTLLALLWVIPQYKKFKF